MENLQKSLPPLVFVLGKGGVGRSSVSAGLASHLAFRGKKTLVVQWALEDSISPWFHKSEAGHSAQEVEQNLFVQNFDSDEAIREYFVDHLKMKLIHKLVIENKHVQKLVQAAPGLHELFFLGRLFWLVDLAKQERGWAFDHIIVDAPATGHSASLFKIAQTMASFGFTGPLSYECERVSRMLADPQKTGVLVVTLPEELPAEETMEFLPKLTSDLNRKPLALFINRSVSLYFGGRREVFKDFEPVLEKRDAAFRKSSELVLKELSKKVEFENFLRTQTAKLVQYGCYSLDEQVLLDPHVSDLNVVKNIASTLGEKFFAGAHG